MKQKYKIRKGDGVEVQGDVFGVWGIDKRDGRYLLTYTPNGGLVESARTMKFLKTLVETPEFQYYNGTKNGTTKLAEAIGRLRNEMGWTA